MPTSLARIALEPLPVLQTSPVPAEPIPLLGTFLLGWVFFAFTAQIAASFVLADPPWRRALLVGAPLAAVSTALIRYDPAIVVAVGLAVDAAAVHLVYEPRPRRTAVIVVIHYTASLALVLLIANLLALLSTAPG